jgi:hypothetical protein
MSFLKAPRLSIDSIVLRGGGSVSAREVRRPCSAQTQIFAGWPGGDLGVENAMVRFGVDSGCASHLASVCVGMEGTPRVVIKLPMI